MVAKCSLLEMCALDKRPRYYLGWENVTVHFLEEGGYCVAKKVTLQATFKEIHSSVAMGRARYRAQAN